MSSYKNLEDIKKEFEKRIDYLNGWLYGAVQAVNGIMKPIEKK